MEEYYNQKDRRCNTKRITDSENRKAVLPGRYVDRVVNVQKAADASISPLLKYGFSSTLMGGSSS